MMIPKDYYVSAKKDSSDSSSVSQSGFRKETYADGKTVGVITPCTIYYADDEYYYVDAGENSELKAGDFLTKDDSEERYQIGMTQTVQGVYNINRGYAVFRRIEILLRMMSITPSKRAPIMVCPSTTTSSWTPTP